MVDASAVGARRATTARNGVAAAFAVNGFAFASWAARLPAARDALELRPGQVGLLLLALSAGAVTALPSSGAVVQRVGAARTVAGGGALVAGALVLVGLGAGAWSSVALTAVGLFALGAGTACWDVAMNVEGAQVERSLGRTLMPRFHAGFSLGTVVGAGTGAVAAAVGAALPLHLALVAVVVTVAAFVPARTFLPAVPAARGHGARRGRHVLRAWTQPRTVLIGVVVLAMAFAEGAANDWLALALVDGYGVSNAAGAVGFGVFVAAMTLGRLLGTGPLDRFGRLPVLRVSVLLVLAGVALVGVGGSVTVALVGSVVWGVGTALGFPVGMSAAADGGPGAAARVSVVSSIGYTAFLAGPPVLGWLADRVGVQHALLAVAAVVLPALLALPAVRPPRSS